MSIIPLRYDYIWRQLFNSFSSSPDYSNIENFAIFSKSIVTNIYSNDTIEIPAIDNRWLLHFIYINILKTSNNLNTSTKVIQPLYITNTVPKASIFEKIIGHSFSNQYRGGLTKITTVKGETYFGGRGIILDGLYNPIILCTIKYKKETHKEVLKDSDYINLIPIEIICYISPKVFLNQTILFYKNIIKKFIPYYSNFRTYIGNYDRNDRPISTKQLDIEIIIKDPNKFFTNAIPPTPSNDINEKLNQCLIDNIYDITNTI